VIDLDADLHEVMNETVASLPRSARSLNGAIRSRNVRGGSSGRSISVPEDPQSVDNPMILRIGNALGCIGYRAIGRLLWW
jgi:hypothetical protein